MSKPALILHGGAGGSFKDKRQLKRKHQKLRKILKAAYKHLLETNALEAVTYAVQLMEDDPGFNAGTGSMLQADGRARLSASVMDGKTQHFAAVINIEQTKNPVLVAKALLQEKYRVLASQEALRFAKALGFKPCDTRTASSIRRWKKSKKEGHDTVGACALDHEGNLASAASTGGRGFEIPGRVSDSGMPIANFADKHCAVTATGIGEDIIEEGLAVKIASRILDGLSLKEAFKRTFQEARKNNRRFAAIGIDSRGKVACAKTTPVLLYAVSPSAFILSSDKE